MTELTSEAVELHEYRIDASDGESDYRLIATFSTYDPIDDLVSLKITNIDGKARMIGVFEK